MEKNNATPQSKEGFNIPQVWNSLNVRQRPRMKATNKQKSMTVPDMTMSIRTLIEKYASGQSLAGEKTPIYDEGLESSGIDLRRLDLIDIQRLQMENKERIAELEAQKKRDEARVAQERENAAKRLEEAKNDALLLEQAKKAASKNKTDEGGTNIS